MGFLWSSVAQIFSTRPPVPCSFQKSRIERRAAPARASGPAAKLSLKRLRAQSARGQTQMGHSQLVLPDTVTLLCLLFLPFFLSFFLSFVLSFFLALALSLSLASPPSL